MPETTAATTASSSGSDTGRPHLCEFRGSVQAVQRNGGGGTCDPQDIQGERADKPFKGGGADPDALLQVQRETIVEANIDCGRSEAAPKIPLLNDHRET